METSSIGQPPDEGGGGHNLGYGTMQTTCIRDLTHQEIGTREDPNSTSVTIQTRTHKPGLLVDYGCYIIYKMLLKIILFCSLSKIAR